jgi:hypothetical protein
MARLGRIAEPEKNRLDLNLNELKRKEKGGLSKYDLIDPINMYSRIKWISTSTIGSLFSTS